VTGGRGNVQQVLGHRARGGWNNLVILMPIVNDQICPKTCSLAAATREL